MPPTPELLALVRAAASKHALDFSFSASSVTYTGTALVCAVVEQESAWDTHAIRYEPAFRTRYVAPLGLPSTEEVARSISWGLMQVMGQVAREHGFTGKFLRALCEPAAGLDIGCAVLASKLAAAGAHLAAQSTDIAVGAQQEGPPGRRLVEPGGSVVPGTNAWLDAAHAPVAIGGATHVECGGLPPLSGIPASRDALGEACLAQETAGASSRTPQLPAIAPSAQSGQGIALTEDEIARALQLWNGGANPDYAAQVLARLAKYK